MANEGVLTRAHRETLEIEAFIFHLIDAELDEPIYLERVALSENQALFFRDRICDAAEGTQYVFLEGENTVQRQSDQIMNGGDAEFVDASRVLAADFRRLHRGNTSNGVFIVAHVSVLEADQRVPLVALVKMDYQAALSLQLQDRHHGQEAVLEEIYQALVEHKSALQKVAIVDLSAAFAWDVLASDTKTPRGIASYFQGFLNVVERENPAVLTRRAYQTVDRWARDNRDTLAAGEDASTVKSRAYRYFEDHDAFDSEEFLRAVIYDPDATRKAGAVDALREQLREAGVAGHRFAPDTSRITRKDRKTTVKTSEGVTMSWDGSAVARRLNLPHERDPETGLFHIMIKTDEYSEH